MRSFDPKSPDETLVYSVSFANFLKNGATIDSQSVSVAVWENSKADDDNQDDILSGSAALNSVAEVIGRTTVPIGAAVIQTIIGGVINCDYVLTFTAVLSTGETVTEDVFLPVRKYVPQ